jgi:flagellar biosynthesis protein FlhG
MIQVNEFSHADLQELRIACAYLFSPELAKDDQFLMNLNALELENALKSKARRYDPDFHQDESDELLQKRRARLVKIRESYDTLKPLLSVSVSRGHHINRPRQKVIAIGGAKGGIGKSILAANLGVLLAARNNRTALIDLDLGSANLHLYLGGQRPRHTLNDYVYKRIPDLQTALFKTSHGPELIGGGESDWGLANMQFAQKLRLLRDLKTIDADYVIIDLGADTSYNTVDFFLAADHGFVLTTCEPASYLDAYNFIKMALLRKLNRIFGPESDFRHQRDPELENIIKAATSPGTDIRGNFFSRLKEQIAQGHPQHLDLMEKVMDSFQISLIVNMIADTPSVVEVVERIQEVSQKLLGLHVNHLGSIHYYEEIKNSAADLVPVVTRYPNGPYAQALNRIVEEIEG